MPPAASETADFANAAVIMNGLERQGLFTLNKPSDTDSVPCKSHLMLFMEMWLRAPSQTQCRQPMWRVSFIALEMHLNPAFRNFLCNFSLGLPPYPGHYQACKQAYMYMALAVCLPCATLLFQPSLPNWSANIIWIWSAAQLFAAHKPQLMFKSAVLWQRAQCRLMWRGKGFY